MQTPVNNPTTATAANETTTGTASTPAVPQGAQTQAKTPRAGVKPRKPASVKPASGGQPLQLGGMLNGPAQRTLVDALAQPTGKDTPQLGDWAPALKELREALAPEPAAQRVLQYSSPADMQVLVEEVAAFVEENKLFAEYASGKYVNVEGWAFAAHRLGWLVKVGQVVRLPFGPEAYQATATVVHLASRCKLGKGVALASREEAGKATTASFALVSMAQTRAVSKAYRNLLGFVIAAAGYQPTPASEMDYQNGPATPVATAAASARIAAQQRLAPVPAAEPAPAHQLLEPVTPGPDGMDYSQPQVELEPGTDAPEEASQDGETAPLVALPEDAAEVEGQSIMEFTTGLEGKPINKAVGLTLPENQWATVAQKEDVIRLCNHPAILRQEKTKMLLGINRLTASYAVLALEKMRRAIAEREGGHPALG